MYRPRNKVLIKKGKRGKTVQQHRGAMCCEPGGKGNKRTHFYQIKASSAQRPPSEGRPGSLG